jgi:ferric-dicitrate binding protein FerR (iron transport regulator)
MSTPFEQLNDADLELISAYIDGEVTAEERAALEARMERDPALRAAFEELQATAQLLHDLPRMTPPRSFTIDPASVRPRRAGAFVWLRFGSALAAVLLALTVTFDLVGSRGAGMATMSAPAAPAVSDQSAGGTAHGGTSEAAGAPSAKEGATASESSAAGSQPASTSAPAAGASGATGAISPAESAPNTLMAVPTEQATESIQSTNSGPSNTTTLRSAEQPTATEQPPQAQNTPAPAASGGIAESGSSSPGAQAFEQPAAQPMPPQEPLRPLRLAEFALAALALGLGLAALWVARRGHR